MAVKSLAALLFTLAVASAEVKETESGLKVEYISKPDACDKVARNGDMLSMHYVGTLESGAKFDSSYDRSEPFKFQIGVGQMIKGWEEGVLGMCVGEKRKLIVHPALGYGDQGAADIIQDGATLYFEVELIDTEEGPTPVNVFKQIGIDAGIALRLNSFHQSSIDDPVGEILSIVCHIDQQTPPVSWQLPGSISFCIISHIGHLQQDILWVSPQLSCHLREDYANRCCG